ncbi:MAG: TraC family protein [Bacteriovoracia bacterium]
MAKPLQNFSEFQEEVALAKELPYWDFLESDDCVVLADGSLVQGLHLSGVAIETFDTDTVNRLAVQTRAFLNSLPDGIELQFFVDVNSNYDSLISKHEELQKTKPFVQWISETRIRALRELQTANYLQRRNLYLFVYLRFKEKGNALSSFFSKPEHFKQMRKEEHEKKMTELRQVSAGVMSNLSSVGVSARVLRATDLIEIVYQTLNPKRSSAEPAPKLSVIHREQEFSAQELAVEPKLSLPSPREQIVFSDVIQTADTFFMDGLYNRVITLKTLPEFTHAAMISRLMNLPFHFKLSVQLEVPEQSKELASLQSKRRMAHSMSVSRGGRVTDLESEAKLASTEELLRELMNTGQKVFYFQTAILIWADNRDDLEIKTKAVLSKFREMNGAEALAENIAGFKVFKTILPAGSTTLVRSKRVKTDNLADFIPIYDEAAGSTNPVCLFENRSRGLFSYDPSDSQLPNYNTLVTGSSGSGKSFLNNCILFQYLSQNPLIYVIDIGGSYRKLCEFFGGQYIEISPPKDTENVTAINPFLLPKGATEPSPQKIKFLVSLFESIFTDEDGDKLPKLDKSLLEETILKTYSKRSDCRLSDFKAVLEDSGEPKLLSFAKMLYSWTGSRSYGRLLDAESSLDLSSDMVVFDLKGLSAYPDLQAAMILIITDFILGKVEDIPGRRKQILMDECWELLKSRGASQFMEYCARTLRKTGSGITFITQGLEEIERSAIGPAILNNTATKIILMQRGDLEPIRKVLKLNAQEMSLISSLRQEKGNYSEAFLIANEQKSVIRVRPTAVEYWLATSDAADNALIQKARQKFSDKTLPDIIHYLAIHFPKGSQGVTEL